MCFHRKGNVGILCHQVVNDLKDKVLHLGVTHIQEYLGASASLLQVVPFLLQHPVGMLFVEFRDGIDLYNLETGSLASDLITSVHGAPLNGSPLNLSISYLNYYIDETDQQVKYANHIFVGTKTGDFRLLNSEDLSVSFNRENIRYSGLEDDEIIYAVQHSMWNNNMLTNKGAYSNYSGAMADYGMTCSGRYGVPALDTMADSIA